MAEVSVDQTARHRRAVAAVEAIAAGLGGRPLAKAELAVFRRIAFTDGWAIPVRFSTGDVLTLALLVPADAPFAPSRLAVLDAPPPGRWPHLEPEGLVCVFPEGAAFSPDNPAGVADQLVREGIALLEDGLTGANAQDFRDEFKSYWDLRASGDRPVISLLAPDGVNRPAVALVVEGRLVVGDTEQSLLGWADRNYGFADPRKPRKAHPVLLLWPQAIPLPEQYPARGRDVLSLLGDDTAAINVAGTFFALHTGPHDVVLGLRTGSGVGFAALRVDAPRPEGGSKYPVDPVGRGFRPGHVPPAIALTRNLAPAVATKRRQVERADPDWVHGRDHDPSQLALRQTSIIAVGAGSLGSTPIELLAKAGIPDIYTIDGEALGRENTARHALGASYLGKDKATGLMERLTRDFPHLERLTGVVTRMGPDAQVDWERIRNANLILATTGKWQCDAFLNDLQQEGKFPPVLYCWVEAEAAAAHAVYIPPGGACLRCGMSDTGRPDVAVTSWPQDGQHRVPACGGAFTPYGAADLSWAHSLVAGEALRWALAPGKTSVHKVWVAETSRIVARGGAITPAFKRVFGDPGGGGFVRERAWPQARQCAACRARARAA